MLIFPSDELIDLLDGTVDPVVLSSRLKVSCLCALKRRFAVLVGLESSKLPDECSDERFCIKEVFPWFIASSRRCIVCSAVCPSGISR